MTKKQMAVLVALLGAASLCFGQRLKLSPDLAGRDPEALVNVIIQYNQAPQQRHVDAVVHKGGRHLRTFGVVHGAVYSIPAKALAELANDPDVKYISPDRTVKAAWNQLTPDYKLQAVNANIAQLNGYNGAGVGVAIIDSGITNKTDLHSGGYGSSNAAWGYGGGSRVSTPRTSLRADGLPTTRMVMERTSLESWLEMGASPMASTLEWPRRRA